MEKTFTPEQIDIINRVVFSHIDKMTEEVANIVEKNRESSAPRNIRSRHKYGRFLSCQSAIFNDDNRTDIDRPCAWWGHGSCSKK
ncbi:hypothetical protein LN650_14020 [Klebsiella pneumoniae subsp. pneumoniae]|nr:hypothetical protein [Klebsiella pneumoniae subsp. pneumoniae]